MPSARRVRSGCSQTGVKPQVLRCHSSRGRAAAKGPQEYSVTNQRPAQLPSFAPAAKTCTQSRGAAAMAANVIDLALSDDENEHQQLRRPPQRSTANILQPPGDEPAAAVPATAASEATSPPASAASPVWRAGLRLHAVVLPVRKCGTGGSGREYFRITSDSRMPSCKSSRQRDPRSDLGGRLLEGSPTRISDDRLS